MSRAACLAVVVVAATSAGCAKARLQLPTGDATPITDPSPVLGEVFGRCSGLRTLTLEMGLSGRAGGQRLRAKLLAGLETPSSIRLEAVAPFGPPGFILAASDSASVLLLPRDDRVLRDAAPEDILAALAGVRVAPGDLLEFLAGCPGSTPVSAGARQFGDDWIAIDLEGGGTAYLRRRDRWRPAAIVRPDVRVVFEEWTAGGPGRVSLQSPDPDGPSAFDLSLRLSQVERNAALPAAAFTVDVPPEAEEITLDELRRAGPMRDSAADDSAS